jgi:hypothetical protein
MGKYIACRKNITRTEVSSVKVRNFDGDFYFDAIAFILSLDLFQ